MFGPFGKSKLMFSNGTRNPFHLHQKKSNSKIVQDGDGPVEMFKVYQVYTYISTPTAPMLSFPWGGLLALFHFRLTRCHCGEPRKIAGSRKPPQKGWGNRLMQKPSCVFLIWLFPKIVGFPPKSSILIGFSTINHPFWSTPIFWKHPYGFRSQQIKCLQKNMHVEQFRNLLPYCYVFGEGQHRNFLKDHFKT